MGVGVHVEECPFLMMKMPVNHMQKGAPYGARGHVEDRHSRGALCPM